MILPLPDHIVSNLAQACVRMMEAQEIGVEVIKAPPYTLEDLTSSRWMQSANQDQTRSLIDARVWKTPDQSCTPNAEIFYHKCQKYYSFYSPTSQPYHILAAAEGGLNLSYFRNLPWAQLRPHLVSHGNDYHDIRGHTTYHPRKDVPYEEIVVLIEALRKEGTIIKVTTGSW